MIFQKVALGTADDRVVPSAITRRAWLTATAASLAYLPVACARKKPTGYPGYALIATAADHSVAIVDLLNFRLLRPIALGSAPTAVLAGPAHHAYALTPETGTVHLINTSPVEPKLARSRKLAPHLSAIRTSDDGRHLFAVAPNHPALIEADPLTLEILHTYKLAGPPLALDSNGPLVAVSTGPEPAIELRNRATGGHWVTRPHAPIHALRFRADAAMLLAANPADRLLTALAVPNLATIADLPLAMQPDHLCFSADAGQLFVSGPGVEGVAIVFPYDHLEVEQTLLAGRDPGFMACSAAPPFLFVASETGTDICILNIDTRKEIGLVDIGQRATYIAITPDSQWALACAEASGQMAVIHIPAIRGNRLRSGAALFTMLGVGSRPVHVAVIPAAA